MPFTGRAGLDSAADRDCRQRSSWLGRLKIRQTADTAGARMIAYYTTTKMHVVVILRPHPKKERKKMKKTKLMNAIFIRRLPTLILKTTTASLLPRKFNFISLKTRKLITGGSNLHRVLVPLVLSYCTKKGGDCLRQENDVTI